MTNAYARRQTRIYTRQSADDIAHSIALMEVEAKSLPKGSPRRQALLIEINKLRVQVETKRWTDRRTV